MGFDGHLYFINVDISLACYKGSLMSKYLDWLTFEWLMENLEWVGAGMFVSLAILLLFPILLTIEFRKLNKKKD